MIKKYCKDNIGIKITDFELLDVSFYGCDARFEFEIRDKKAFTMANHLIKAQQERQALAA